MDIFEARTSLAASTRPTPSSSSSSSAGRAVPARLTGKTSTASDGSVSEDPIDMLAEQAAQPRRGLKARVEANLRQHSTSSSTSSASSSSSSSSLFSAGRAPAHSHQTTPATSRSSSSVLDGDRLPPEPSKPGATARVKPNINYRLHDILASVKNRTAAQVEEEEEDATGDGSIVSHASPIDEPIFPLTLYNSAYRFFPSCAPDTSTSNSVAHPAVEAQCPWVIQDGAWGKSAVRCGRQFVSPYMLAKHVLMTHCDIELAAQPEETSVEDSLVALSQGHALLSSSQAPLSHKAATPCRYGTCNHRTFVSTAKMRAHVIEVHLLPSFLYLCPFRSCRLSYSEQPDSQNKLDGHIDRIHDEKTELLIPFAGVGGVGPHGARLSLLRSIPPTLLDEDKGGVHPGAARTHMIQHALVSGIDLEAEATEYQSMHIHTAELAPRRSAVSSPSTPTRVQHARSGTTHLSTSSPLTESPDRARTMAALNKIEAEGIHKVNIVAAPEQLPHGPIDGHWVYGPVVRRPQDSQRSILRLQDSHASVTLGSQPSASRASGHAESLQTHEDALHAELAANEAASDATYRTLTPSQRCLVDAPTHPASVQSRPYKRTKVAHDSAEPRRSLVHPYTILISKLSYLQEPARAVAPSKAMLARPLPTASSVLADKVYRRAQLEAREQEWGAALAANRLPEGQAFVEVYIDRPANSFPLDDIPFLRRGESTFSHVEIPPATGSRSTWMRVSVDMGDGIDDSQVSTCLPPASSRPGSVIAATEFEESPPDPWASTEVVEQLARTVPDDADMAMVDDTDTMMAAADEAQVSDASVLVSQQPSERTLATEPTSEDPADASIGLPGLEAPSGSDETPMGTVDAPFELVSSPDHEDGLLNVPSSSFTAATAPTSDAAHVDSTTDAVPVVQPAASADKDGPHTVEIIEILDDDSDTDNGDDDGIVFISSTGPRASMSTSPSKTGRFINRRRLYIPPRASNAASRPSTSARTLSSDVM